MLKKIKLRLTLINAFVFVCVLVLVQSFTYVTYSAKLSDASRQETLSIVGSIKRLTPYLEQDITTLDEEIKAEYSSVQSSMRNINSGYVLLDDRGNIIRSGENVFVNPDDIKAYALLSLTPNISNDPSFEVITQPDGEYITHDYTTDISNYRLVSSVYQNDKGEIRVLVFVKNVSGEKRILANFSAIIYLSTILATLACVVISYFLASRSLVPIQQSIENQNKFVADASHELRTPLSVVQTNLEVASDIIAEEKSEATVWISNAYDETIRMQKLVKNLLFLARQDIPSTKVDMHKQDIVYIIKDVCEKIVFVAAKKDIYIDFDSDLDEILVYANKDMLYQLFMILIDNAIKFSPSGANVKIRTDTSQVRTKIEVSDRGCGMSESTKEHAFERFYMEDSARSKKEGGTGLGLSIARSIMDVHNGTIMAYDNDPVGTKIEVMFPLYSGKEK